MDFKVHRENWKPQVLTWEIKSNFGQGKSMWGVGLSPRSLAKGHWKIGSPGFLRCSWHSNGKGILGVRPVRKECAVSLNSLHPDVPFVLSNSFSWEVLLLVIITQQWWWFVVWHRLSSKAFLKPRTIVIFSNVYISSTQTAQLKEYPCLQQSYFGHGQPLHRALL